MKDEDGDDELKPTNDQKKEELQDLRSRTTDLAVRVIRLCDDLPKRRRSTTVIANQLVRCGTAVGAHYREGARSRSDAELISKLETALQELDETDYWLELLVKSQIMTEKRLTPLRGEVDQLIAILVTVVKKIKNRRKS